MPATDGLTCVHARPCSMLRRTQASHYSLSVSPCKTRPLAIHTRNRIAACRDHATTGLGPDVPMISSAVLTVLHGRRTALPPELTRPKVVR